MTHLKSSITRIGKLGNSYRNRIEPRMNCDILKILVEEQLSILSIVSHNTHVIVAILIGTIVMSVTKNTIKSHAVRAQKSIQTYT